MSLARRTLTLLAFSSAAALLCCGCPAEKTPSASGEAAHPPASRSGAAKRIVILTNGDDPFWDACQTGATKAAQELGLEGEGFVMTFDRADFTDKGQVDKIKQYSLDKNLAAFGISVYNPDSPAVAKELRDLRKRGIPVVTIDGDINREQYRDARFAYLGTDNIVGGRELGRAAKALAPEGAKFAFFVGNVGAANAIARMDGFKDGAGEKIVEVERLEDRGDRPTARKNVQDALDRHADINMLVGIWAYNTPQAVAVVKDRKIRDKTKVVCFDAAEASLAASKEGNVDVMVVQNPYQMGYVGVKLLKALTQNQQDLVKEMYPDYAQEGERDLFRTELRVVVPDQGSTITPDLFEKDTVFMKLGEFEQWLKERGLTSS